MRSGQGCLCSDSASVLPLLSGRPRAGAGGRHPGEARPGLAARKAWDLAMAFSISLLRPPNATLRTRVVEGPLPLLPGGWCGPSGEGPAQDRGGTRGWD